MATTPQRRRRGPNPLLLPLAGAAVLALGAALWFFTRNTAPPAPATPPRPPGTIAVPVAARAISKGTEMEGNGLIRPMYLRPEAVPEDAILQPNGILSRVTRQALRPGEYFSEGKLAPPGAPRGFSGLLAPGHRMVVMDMGALTGVAGQMREGDVVDIYALSAPAAPGGRGSGSLNAVGNSVQPGAGGAINRGGAAAGGPPPTMSAVLIAQNVRVVNAPPAPPRTPPNRRNPPPAPLAALEVHEEDAPQLQIAINAGQRLQVVYKPFAEARRVSESTPADDRVVRALRDPKLVEVIEGTERRMTTAVMD
ncbi:Flp pilus assembly protein CpaB [Aquariibacter albus]|uniref:Flp pilus assembly protein CpaB n=1 Tax=Aquariibacter albus TaxID=2759899 RepID=A0A839HEZ8_9BURK|nr:Flp pilus assembly protein CpaB [Aquariibacter albus]MBB1160427.1 Flp pilus assembly protein CpaB [Aquariibacter albus]